MNTALWEKAEDLFGQVLALPPEARAAFLDGACASNPALRAEMDSLLSVYADASPFFDNLASGLGLPSPAPVLQPEAQDPLLGQMVGPYRVLGLLGRGGMGVVYRAQDPHLSRTVALKLLPPAWTQDEQAKARFRREAQAASRLDHPNICTIHAVGETDQGQLYIAMACYEGETLRSRIDRMDTAPLPLTEALSYTRQVARGLAKAHAYGIIHRDVKPGNVIITEPPPGASVGLLKLLDFGLAKHDGTVLTRTGTTLGTAAYMSPEQARGDTIDARSDLWSLGVMTYEMLTGTRPFQGDYGPAVVYSVLHEDPLPLAHLVPDIPPALAALVMQCLSKDPDARPASAEALLEGLAPVATAAPQAPAPRSRPTSYQMVGLGLLGVVVFVGLLWLLPSLLQRWFMGRPAAPALPEEQHLAVIPFANLLGNDDDSDSASTDALVAGLTPILTSMVSRFEAPDRPLWVVPASEVRTYGVSSVTDAYRTFGVNTVLGGSVQRLGAALMLTFELIDPESRRVLSTTSTHAPLGPVLHDSLLVAVTRLLRAPFSAVDQQAISRQRPSNAEAYAFYLQGLGYLQRFDRPGHLDLALRLFDEALEQDSAFALAYAARCEARWEKYNATEDLSWADRALSSCEQAVALQPDLVPVIVARGRIYFETGRLREAETELQRALALDANHTEAYQWLGWVYDARGDFPAARDALREAIARKPEAWRYHQDLGIFYFTVDSLALAGKAFERQIDLAPDNHLGYNNLGVQRRNIGQEAEAKALFERSIQARPNEIAYRNLGQLYFRDQQYADAAKMFAQARDLQPNDYITWGWLGNAYYWTAGQREQAEAAWRKLIELATPRLTVTPRHIPLLTKLAETHIMLGEADQGRVYLAQLLLNLPAQDATTRFNIARMYEILGNRTLALGYLEQALDGGMDPIVIDRDPWLQALRATPDYAPLRPPTPTL